MTDIFSDRDHWKLTALQLLAALKTVVAQIEDYERDCWQSAAQARAAIAKAESQS